MCSELSIIKTTRKYDSEKLKDTRFESEPVVGMQNKDMSQFCGHKYVAWKRYTIKSNNLRCTLYYKIFRGW